MFLVYTIFDVVLCNEDPYVTLGLSRKATVREIKRAYKNLAKEWHPDKNDSPKAHEKFMAITRAYETLSDPLKKERYDKYGTFDEPPTEGYRHAAHHFEEFFGFGFGGFDNGNSYFQKHRISMRMFSHSLLEKSFSQPLIVFAYSGYCQLCFRLEPIWQSVVEDLEPLGYGVGTVNAITDGNLLEKLRVSRLPSIVVVVEGRVIHYRGSMHPLSAKSVRIFARDVIPNTFLLKINNHDGLRRFIDQWKSYNKISVLIFGAKEDPRIRYVLTAMKYATFARFAYIHLNENNEEVLKMREALGIQCVNCENMLIFNDFPEKGPVARLSVGNGKQLSIEAIDALIESNKHLIFPRLASQAHLDDLCPVSSRNARKLCVVLTVVDSSADQRYISTMRQFVRREGAPLAAQRIQFAYMFVDKQKEFILPFLEGLPKEEQSSQGAKRDVVVVWRLEHSRARFAWLRGVWDATETSLNASGEELKKRLDEILRGTSKLDYQAALVTLTDEFRPSLFTRISRAAMRMGETAWFHLSKEEALPVLSAVGTFLVILLIGYGLNYAAISEERTHSARQVYMYICSCCSILLLFLFSGELVRKRANEKMTKNMYPTKYLEMRRKVVRVYYIIHGIAVLVTMCTVRPCAWIQQMFLFFFFSNKTFSFGYLMVEKNLPWFRKLLEYTLPVENPESTDQGEGGSVEKSPAGKVAASLYERLKSINPRKTLGTVLVLCGWKLYFNMYHPMHTAARRKNFLGFDDDGEEESSSEDSDSEKATHEEVQALRKGYQLKLEDVLNGLPNWLDRLFEGSIRRYYIPEWPDNLK
ncbi:DnaJ -like protein subfamily C member 16 [Toxocara canis]|uniref:DnaJ-like protein subfamily C member 16 n=1 Tax=Toxocara canis TaxID=6265 RepID=A0A0B2VFW6_TOXCA|nr:DnaJ -like protein subfamily C member 16 [Toxocara canis]